MTMRTLHCEAGNHTWERPSQRGRIPINCPEHSEPKAVSSGLSGLEAAHAARASKKSAEEKIWAEKVEAVINDPRMQVNSPDRHSTDARPNTVSKLRYIQDQLTNRRDRPQHELADLEKIRAKIMENPFSSTGHLY